MRDFNAIVVTIAGVVIGLVIITGSTVECLLLDQRIDALESRQRPTELSRVLVGTGCDGPSPIAVAIEEDLLPACEAIEVHQVALGER